MRLYLLDDENLEQRYYIFPKQMELFWRVENSSELKHENNARLIIDFFERKLFAEFGQKMKPKFFLNH